MIEEDSFVELANACVRACHVLKTVTDGRDTDSLRSPSERQIEDLGRCVDPAQPPLLTMTSDTRTVRHIESAVKERANCARDSQEHHPGSIDEAPVAWQTEVLERLRVLDVCCFQLAVPTRSKLPQGDLGQGGILEVGSIEQRVQGSIGVDLLAPASVVCYCFVISIPYPLLTIDSP